MMREMMIVTGITQAMVTIFSFFVVLFLPGAGIDWDELDRTNIQNHHREHNEADIRRESTNVFDTGTPEELSHVEVPITSCPLTPEGVQMLTNHLEQLPYYFLNDENSLVNVWNAASNFLRSQSTLPN